MKTRISAAMLLTALSTGGPAMAQQTDSALGDAQSAMRAAEQLTIESETTGPASVQVDASGVRVNNGASIEVTNSSVRIGDTIDIDGLGVSVEAATRAGDSANHDRMFSDGEFISVNQAGANFSGAVFTNYDFIDADFSNADFSNATLQNVDFMNTNLEGACFAGATLTNTDFDSETRLKNVIMTGAVQVNVDFAIDVRQAFVTDQDCGRHFGSSAASLNVGARADLISAAEIISSLSMENSGAIDLTVNFDTDSDQILGQARAQVLEIANALNSEALQASRVSIEGHTDSVGDNLYNDDLSYRRAVAVRRALSDDYGIDHQQISVTGFGEKQPIASNQSDRGRALNRRVTLRNLGQ